MKIPKLTLINNRRARGGVFQSLGSLQGVTRLPQRLQTIAPVVIDTLSDIATWPASSGSSRALNTTEYAEGGSSIEVTAGSAGGTGDIRRTFSSAQDFSAAQYFTFWVYVHNSISDLSTSANISLRFDTQASGFTTDYYRYVMSMAVCAAGRWLRVTCPKSKFTATGSPVGWHNITRLQCRFVSAAGATASISFDEISYTARGVPFVMFRFDDGPALQYSTLFPILRAKNIPGTLYIPSSYPGTAGYVTWAQLREMQAAGWTIGNHSASHVALTLLTEAEQETELSTCAAALAAEGLNGGLYHAYPLGEWNADTLTAMAATGMLTGHDNYPLYNTIPPHDWYLIGSRATDDDVPLATFTGDVDDAIASGTGVCWHFHQVGEAGDVSLETFNGVVAYVAEKARAGLVYPITIDHFYRLNSGPVDVPIIS